MVAQLLALLTHDAIDKGIGEDGGRPGASSIRVAPTRLALLRSGAWTRVADPPPLPMITWSASRKPVVSRGGNAT
jgi:hypothetical protein